MRNIVKYLVPVIEEGSDIEARINYEIVEVKSNPFRLPGTEDLKSAKDYCLYLSSEYRFTEEEGEGWIDGSIGDCSGYPLKFYWTGFEKPSIQFFSAHIYKECRASYKALQQEIHDCKHYPLWQDRQEIDLIHVWNFLQALKISSTYSETPKFIEEYDYWHDRLYNNLKWLAYLSGDREWNGGYLEIGDRLFEFLRIKD